MAGVDQHNNLFRRLADGLQPALEFGVNERFAVDRDQRFGAAAGLIRHRAAATVAGVIDEDAIILPDAFLQTIERAAYPVERQILVAELDDVFILHTHAVRQATGIGGVVSHALQRCNAALVVTDSHDEGVRFGQRAGARIQQRDRQHRTAKQFACSRHGWRVLRWWRRWSAVKVSPPDRSKSLATA